MESKEKIKFSEIRNSIEVLQSERSGLEAFLKKIIKIWKSLEESNEAADKEIQKLRIKEHKIEASCKVCEFQEQKLLKKVENLEEKDRVLRENVSATHLKIKGYNEECFKDTENFEKEAQSLSENFLSSFSIKGVGGVNENIYNLIEETRKEYEETITALNKAKNELDDIIMYQTPRSQKEIEIPLSQRKVILKIFENALVEAKSSFNNLKEVKSSKEAELEKLNRSLF
ncbi:synaptonemal complex protein 1-like [Stegodyphus dumicola]|uniref:synaptonemal complex protein 1-like n=1 Tax=Stegodyphus dumicola TaxID=202533 RepID=UPI0015A83AF3|nr:synaptonemal complex protein 1-like [Stegodyphus dumicola]